jgi:hypothetical protein
MIDERELSITRGAPLHAWRLFRVRRLPDGYALCAPMIHSPAPPPWQPGYTVARCLEHDHAAPAPGCRCGIYAAIEGTLDSLPGYLLDTAYDGDPWTYAEVACSGRVSWTRAVCAARRPSSCRSSLPRGPSQAQTSGCARPRILRRATAFVWAQVMLHPAGSQPPRAGEENRSRLKALTSRSFSRRSTAPEGVRSTTARRRSQRSARTTER